MDAVPQPPGDRGDLVTAIGVLIVIIAAVIIVRPTNPFVLGSAFGLAAFSVFMGGEALGRRRSSRMEGVFVVSALLFLCSTGAWLVFSPEDFTWTDELRNPLVVQVIGGLFFACAGAGGGPDDEESTPRSCLPRCADGVSGAAGAPVLP